MNNRLWSLLLLTLLVFTGEVKAVEVNKNLLVEKIWECKRNVSNNVIEVATSIEVIYRRNGTFTSKEKMGFVRPEAYTLESITTGTWSIKDDLITTITKKYNVTSQDRPDVAKRMMALYDLAGRIKRPTETGHDLTIVELEARRLVTRPGDVEEGQELSTGSDVVICSPKRVPARSLQVETIPPAQVVPVSPVSAKPPATFKVPGQTPKSQPKTFEVPKETPAMPAVPEVEASSALPPVVAVTPPEIVGEPAAVSAEPPEVKEDIPEPIQVVPVFVDEKNS